jgi:hypothetical protein
LESANGLIGAIGARLGDFFQEYSLKILQKLFYMILLGFVLKICQNYVIFKVFQIHLQVLLHYF